MNKYFSIIIAALLFVSGSWFTSCSNEVVNDEETKKQDKQIVIRVKTNDISWTSLDPKTRFTQTLPNGGNGKPLYAFEIGDELDAYIDSDYVFGSGNFSYVPFKCVEIKEEYAIFVGSGNAYDFYANTLNKSKDTPLYFTLSSPTHKLADLKTGLLPLAPVNNDDYYIGTQLKTYGSGDYGNTFLYGKAKGLVNVDGENNPTSMWNDVELNMVRSYATIKLSEETLSTVMSGENLLIEIENDNNVFYGQGYWTDKAPVSLDIKTGMVKEYDYEYENKVKRNSFLVYSNALEDIINNYDGLISLPLYPGEYKNLKITVSTRAFMKDYTWSSNPVSFSVVIGSPSKVDDPANSVYSANRNFFFGNVTLAEKQ